MPLAAEKEYAHIGETSGCRDHDHDLVHELSRRLDSLWRFDQYVANAEDKPDLQSFWRKMKKQEVQNVEQIKELMQKEMESGCF